jgi:heterodisulfide reductase subunit A
MPKHVVVIGGGIAGMEAATVLSGLGHRVTIVEKEEDPGGKLKQWGHLFPDFSDPQELVSGLQQKTLGYGINVICQAEVTGIAQQKGRLVVSTGADLQLSADAVVVSTGFSLFDATYKEEYGYGIFENVITSADYEWRIREGGQLRTAGGDPPGRIAIIHCVGSRDAKSGNTYCSKVCCITGVKQAIEINRMWPECEIFCFYMDLRLYGSTFDSLYLAAQQKHKIQFIRGRLSEASERLDKSLQVKAEDTLSGRPLRMVVDMIILLVGMEPGTAPAPFDRSNGNLDENGFIRSANMHHERNLTAAEGIFAAGACLCPMSVSETLENARSAATAVHTYLKTRK